MGSIEWPAEYTARNHRYLQLSEEKDQYGRPLFLLDQKNGMIRLLNIHMLVRLRFGISLIRTEMTTPSISILFNFNCLTDALSMWIIISKQRKSNTRVVLFHHILGNEAGKIQFVVHLVRLPELLFHFSLTQANMCGIAICLSMKIMKGCGPTALCHRINLCC